MALILACCVVLYKIATYVKNVFYFLGFVNLSVQFADAVVMYSQNVLIKLFSSRTYLFQLNGVVLPCSYFI